MIADAASYFVQKIAIKLRRRFYTVCNLFQLLQDQEKEYNLVLAKLFSEYESFPVNLYHFEMIQIFEYNDTKMYFKYSMNLIFYILIT